MLDAVAGSRRGAFDAVPRVIYNLRVGRGAQFPWAILSDGGDNYPREQS